MHARHRSQLGRRAGSLLADSRTSDVIDAVVPIAQDSDEIHTSDPGDMLHLTRAAGTDVEIIAV